jgi:probable phosphoglycerate mutase
MRLIIIRHGDPDYANDNLTEKGKREAECLVDRIAKLDVKAFYCSPLGRAIATAEPTLKALGRDAEILPWLREFPAHIIDPETGRKRGAWDLKPITLAQNPDLFDREKWLKTDLMQTGNVEEIYHEVCKGLDELLAKHGYVHDGYVYKVEHENEDTIVLFCHFGLESVLLSHILNVSPVVIWQGFVALPTGVTILNTEEREQGIAYFRCSRFGDLSHLDIKGEPESFAARFCETFSNTEQRH